MDGFAKDVFTSGWISCRDPATGERLGEVPVMDLDQVRAAIQRARATAPRWYATTVRQRRKVLRLLLDRIIGLQDEICRLAVHESGKTMVAAAMGEIVPVCERIRHTLRSGARDPKSERTVVGIIAAGDMPFRDVMEPLVAALFAGKAVVVKLSEGGSWSGGVYLELVREVLRDCRHDPQLVQGVTGRARTEAALIESGVMFGASKVVPRTQLAAVLVADDLEGALDTAMFNVYTVGLGTTHLHVHPQIYDRFVDMAVRRVAAIRQGPPLEDFVDCGATATACRLERIAALVDDAVNKGARALVGGRTRTDLPGMYFQPTVLVDVDPSMQIAHEDVPGPMLVISKIGKGSPRSSTVPDDGLPFGRALAFLPVGEHTYDLVESAVRLLYGRGVRRRTRAALDSARSLAQVFRDP